MQLRHFILWTPPDPYALLFEIFTTELGDFGSQCGWFKTSIESHFNHSINIPYFGSLSHAQYSIFTSSKTMELILYSTSAIISTCSCKNLQQAIS